MGWETRARGGRYYTRSVRIGGRVCRQYIGKGELAEAMAGLDALDRARREDARDEARERRRQADAAEAAVADFCREVEAALRAALEAAGYHRHKRGEWRKRRVTGERQGEHERQGGGARQEGGQNGG
ncbi:MAG: hypothetical protein JO250_18390 [Armatimonadetes bacterium]|nr:hypothetical protein [Armatimonadota bacterium]